MKGIWGMGSIGVMVGGKGVCAASWSAGEKVVLGESWSSGEKVVLGSSWSAGEKARGRGGPDKIIKLKIN